MPEGRNPRLEVPKVSTRTGFGSKSDWGPDQKTLNVNYAKGTESEWVEHMPKYVQKRVQNELNILGKEGKPYRLGQRLNNSVPGKIASKVGKVTMWPARKMFQAFETSMYLSGIDPRTGLGVEPHLGGWKNWAKAKAGTAWDTVRGVKPPVLGLDDALPRPPQGWQNL